MSRPRFASVSLAGWAALLALLWSVAGCATLPAYQPGVSVAEDVGRTLLHDWLATSRRHDTLQGVAKVRVQTAERSVSGTQVLLAERPDRLRAETLSPFGTPLLVLAADGRDLGVWLPGENLYYGGPATPENLSRFTRLPLHAADLVDILLARPPVIAHRQLTTFLLPAGGWRVELVAGSRGQHLLFDGNRRLREVRYLKGEELQLQLAYGDAGPEPQALPRRIDLEVPGEKVRASLIFTELATDRPPRPGTFTLAVPPGAAVVRLDDPTLAGEHPGGGAPLPVIPQALPPEGN
jgi:hypothetical protein